MTRPSGPTARRARSTCRATSIMRQFAHHEGCNHGAETPDELRQLRLRLLGRSQQFASVHANHMQYKDAAHAAADPMKCCRAPREKFVKGYIDFDRIVFGVALAQELQPRARRDRPMQAHIGGVACTTLVLVVLVRRPWHVLPVEEFPPLTSTPNTSIISSNDTARRSRQGREDPRQTASVRSWATRSTSATYRSAARTSGFPDDAVSHTATAEGNARGRS